MNQDGARGKERVFGTSASWQNRYGLQLIDILGPRIVVASVMPHDVPYPQRT